MINKLTRLIKGSLSKNEKDIVIKINELIDYLNNTITPTVDYKVYIALLTQSGTAAPTAIILENTLGSVPVLSYFTLATYKVTLNGAFVENKTDCIGSSNRINDSLLSADRLSANEIIITSTTISTDAPTNGLFTKQRVEIRVYN